MTSRNASLVGWRLLFCVNYQCCEATAAFNQLTAEVFEPVTRSYVFGQLEDIQPVKRYIAGFPNQFVANENKG